MVDSGRKNTKVTLVLLLERPHNAAAAVPISRMSKHLTKRGENWLKTGTFRSFLILMTIMNEREKHIEKEDDCIWAKSCSTKPYIRVDSYLEQNSVNTI